MLGRIPQIARTGTAVILAGKNLSKALDVTHRAYVLRVGSIVIEGMASDLRSDPSIRSNFWAVFSEVLVMSVIGLLHKRRSVRELPQQGGLERACWRSAAGRGAITKRHQHAALARLCSYG